MRALHAAATSPALAVLLAAGAAAVEPSPPAPAARPPQEHLAEFFGRTKGITRIVPAADVWASLAAGDPGLRRHLLEE